MSETSETTDLSGFRGFLEDDAANIVQENLVQSPGVHEIDVRNALNFMETIELYHALEVDKVIANSEEMEPEALADMHRGNRTQAAVINHTMDQVMLGNANLINALSRFRLTYGYPLGVYSEDLYTEERYVDHGEQRWKTLLDYVNPATPRNSGEEYIGYNQVRAFFTGIQSLEPFCQSIGNPSVSAYAHLLEDGRIAVVTINHHPASEDFIMTHKASSDHELAIINITQHPNGVIEHWQQYAVTFWPDDEPDQYMLPRATDLLYKTDSKGNREIIPSQFEEATWKALLAFGHGDQEEGNRIVAEDIGEIWAVQSEMEDIIGREGELGEYLKFMKVLREVQADLDIEQSSAG